MTAVLPEDEVIAATILRARSVAEKVEYWTQRRVDTMIAAVGWHCYREDNVRAMSQFAYQSTGLGDAAEMFSLHRPHPHPREWTPPLRISRVNSARGCRASRVH
jgi:hypothetical protein